MNQAKAQGRPLQACRQLWRGGRTGVELCGPATSCCLTPCTRAATPIPAIASGSAICRGICRGRIAARWSGVDAPVGDGGGQAQAAQKARRAGGGHGIAMAPRASPRPIACRSSPCARSPIRTIARCPQLRWWAMKADGSADLTAVLKALAREPGAIARPDPDRVRLRARAWRALLGSRRLLGAHFGFEDLV